MPLPLRADRTDEHGRAPGPRDVPVTVAPAGGAGPATTVVAADGAARARGRSATSSAQLERFLGELREPACEDGVERAGRSGRPRPRRGRCSVACAFASAAGLSRTKGRLPVSSSNATQASAYWSPVRLCPPRACSGGHVAGRAEHGPGERQVSFPAARAMPKSETRIVSSSATSRLAGFTSRWTIRGCAPGRACRRSLLEPAQRLLGVDAAGAQPVGDRPAGDVLHHDERQVVPRLPHVVDHDHVRLAGEARGGLRLAQETRVELVVPGVALGEHFHGDRPPERLVGRPVDLPHAPVRDQLRVAYRDGSAGRVAGIGPLFPVPAPSNPVRRPGLPDGQVSSPSSHQAGSPVSSSAGSRLRPRVLPPLALPRPTGAGGSASSSACGGPVTSRPPRQAQRGHELSIAVAWPVAAGAICRHTTRMSPGI